MGANQRAKLSTVISTIQSLALVIGTSGIGPPSDPYKRPALTIELRAVEMGPERVELSPRRLKGGYAAVTPRPHSSGYGAAFDKRVVHGSLPA